MKKMNARGKLGDRGEAIAASFLERLGYKIVERNYRCGIGEIDLIASKDQFLVFIEVKTRSAGARVHPSLSVTARKQTKVRKLGEQYCSRHPRIIKQPRFDVISVVLGEKEEKVEHLINAF